MYITFKGEENKLFLKSRVTAHSLSLNTDVVSGVGLIIVLGLEDDSIALLIPWISGCYFVSIIASVEFYLCIALLCDSTSGTTVGTQPVYRTIILVLNTLALSNLSIYHTEYFLLHMTSENNDNHVFVYSIITINLVYVTI